jgi:predicted dehydrogenase
MTSEPSPGPSLRVVIAGAGRFGTLHARVWEETGATVAGVVDVEPDRARALAQRHRGALAGTDLGDVVARSGARAVVVASDELSHTRLTDQALEAGCHVFVEKPLAVDPAVAAATTARAAALGRHVVAGMISRFADPYVYARDCLDRGALGTLWALRLRRDFSRSWFAGFGGRVHPVWESGIHDIDLALYLTDSRPVRVYAVESAAAGEAAPSVLTVLVEFASGVTATIESAWALPDLAPRTLAGALALDGCIAAECEVIGSEGVLKQRLVSDAVQRWAGDGVTAPDLSLWPERDGRVGGALAREVELAARLFRGEATAPAVPVAQAVAGVAVAAAVEESLRSGAPVALG